MTDKPNPVAVKALAKRPNGATLDELVFITGCPEQAVKDVCDVLVAEGSIQLRNIVYYTTEPKPPVTVSPFARSLLSELRCSGLSGIQPGRLKLAGAEDILAELAKKDLAIDLGDGIYYSLEAYAEVTETLLKGLKPAERFSLNHAKEATQLSRKYLIPILEKLESDGYVRRQGNDRIVVKGDGGTDDL